MLTVRTKEIPMIKQLILSLALMVLLVSGALAAASGGVRSREK